MPENVKDKALAKLQRAWQGFQSFSPGQKVVTGVAVLALVIGGFVFSSLASRPDYQPLFTNLAPTDASSIIDKLNANKTPYKLGADGTEVLVPKKDVYSTRLSLSADGLPSSGQSGYSLLDKEGITTSDFKQHVDYQRALEGELGKTIQSINGVTNAQVHLAIPQQTVFDDGTNAPTAAVLLTTTPGQTLTSGQVQSVVNLVSSSVPGMTPDKVSVSDSTGKVLSDSNGVEAGGTSNQSEATQQYDQQLQSSVQQLLDPILGAGHSKVTVNADLDFDKSNSTEHTYTYASGVPPIAESNSTEIYGGGGANAGGVLGANTVTDAASPAATGTGSYQKTTDTKNNAVGEVTKVTQSAPGQVRKLSVAVLLDKNAPAVDTDAIRDLISSAVGIDPQRGDSLALTTAAFDTSQQTAAQAAADKAAKAAEASKKHAEMMSMLKTGGVVLLVIIVIVVTLILNRRRRPEEPIDDLDEFLSTLNDSPGSLPPAPEDIVPPQSRDVAIAAARQRELAELADSDPDEVARLLRAWMNSKES